MLSFRVTPRKDRVDVFVTKSDLKEDLDFNDLSDMDDYSGFLQKSSSRPLRVTLWTRVTSKHTSRLEELEKTLEEVDKAMTEPTKEVAEENIREDYTLCLGLL